MNDEEIAQGSLWTHNKSKPKKRKPAARGETIRILLESVTLGSAEHVGLVFAQTVDVEGKSLPEKLRFFVVHPRG